MIDKKFDSGGSLIRSEIEKAKNRKQLKEYMEEKEKRKQIQQGIFDPLEKKYTTSFSRGFSFEVNQSCKGRYLSIQ